MMKHLLLLTVIFSPAFSMDKNKIKETSRLTKVVINNSDGNSSDLDNFDNKSRCSICFERYNEGEIKRVDILCDPQRKIYHRYCKLCITDWVRKNESCPTCKRPIKLKDVPNYDYFSSIIAYLQKLCCCK